MSRPSNVRVFLIFLTLLDGRGDGDGDGGGDGNADGDGDGEKG